jgi:hypothetical protein
MIKFLSLVDFNGIFKNRNNKNAKKHDEKANNNMIGNFNKLGRIATSCSKKIIGLIFIILLKVKLIIRTA